MIDRMTKTLLALIAVALWGLLLHPLLTTPTVKADDTSVQVTSSNGILFVVRNNHFINADKIDKSGQNIVAAGSAVTP
jgi:hypothetical protein